MTHPDNYPAANQGRALAVVIPLRKQRDVGGEKLPHLLPLNCPALKVDGQKSPLCHSSRIELNGANYAGQLSADSRRKIKGVSAFTR